MLRDLRGLSKDGAEFVAGHLVAAGSLADEEPELAWLHARAARARGGRIAVVRETVGLVAYRAGEWADAIGELRAARRMGGGPGHLAVMADSERALGHPERAIELSRSAEADDLDEDAAIELAIVVAGARADLGQIDAALAHLERIGWREEAPNPRIAYAYADLLLQAGRRQEALTWFVRAADADSDEETDAGDRLVELSATLGETNFSAAGSGSDDLVSTDVGSAGFPPVDGAISSVDMEPAADLSDTRSATGPAAGSGHGAEGGGDSDTKEPDDSDTAVGTAGFETVGADVEAASIAAGGVTAESSNIGYIETDDPGTTFDADGTGTAASTNGTGEVTGTAASTNGTGEVTGTGDGTTGTGDVTVTVDGTDAETGPAADEPPAGESDDQGLADAADANVPDTDTDSTTGTSTAMIDPTPGAGDASPSADPLFVPPLFSDDPLAGDR